MKSGFLSAAAGAAIGHLGISKALKLGEPSTGGPAKAAARTVLAGVTGGIVSEVSGGSFANGAYTAAFQHLFNAEVSAAAHAKRLKTHQSYAQSLNTQVESGSLTSLDAGVMLSERVAQMNTHKNNFWGQFLGRGTGGTYFDHRRFIGDMSLVAAGINFNGSQNMTYYGAIRSATGFAGHLDDGSPQFRHFIGMTNIGYRYEYHIGNAGAFGREVGSSLSGNHLIPDYKVKHAGVRFGADLANGRFTSSSPSSILNHIRNVLD